MTAEFVPVRTRPVEVDILLRGRNRAFLFALSVSALVVCIIMIWGGRGLFGWLFFVFSLGLLLAAKGVGVDGSKSVKNDE
ncbi:hypothetical protein [Actinopolyspora mortivallis]|uniref:hypothetical protein n=1 Tax=Actinopolyspora mortivallis TaxID=33906 RepID=UPI0011B26D29|nr:hypothetical protein [Actinopolyspora mortivallis]